MSPKRRAVVALLAAVAAGMCLLTTLPAVLLIVTGRGHRILAANEKVSLWEQPASQTFVAWGGDGDGHGAESNSESRGAERLHGHDEDEDSRPVGHQITREPDDTHLEIEHVDADHSHGGVPAPGTNGWLPSKSNKKSAWDEASVADLKRRQTTTFTKYALTGFRNKATTDARILTQFLLSITPRPESCAIFDVGANIGKYVEELKLMPVARSCDIHAFEPNPDVFTIMERHVRSLTRVFLNNKGVADKPGNLTFYYQPGKADTGGSFNPDHSYEKLQGTGRMSTANVDVITIDDYLTAKVDPSIVIPLVKIDVEGLEYRVKQGMELALRAGRIQAVYWERKGSLKLEPFKDEVEYMADRGYYVYIMGCSGARKHNCRLTLVRVDGAYFDTVYDPKNHRAPGGGKYMTMNMLGVQRDHPFNDKVFKTMLATGL